MLLSRCYTVALPLRRCDDGGSLVINRHVPGRIALLLACAWEPALAVQRWISVATPHFEMYTTNSEKQAARALQVFEQVRYFFLQNINDKQRLEGRVRVIAFSSEKEYRPYRLNSGAFAYYLQSRERDYIVMQDIEPSHHQTAVHEYTHLIVQHLKLDLPIWLNEGMADLYSSLEPRGQQAMVGRPLDYHLLTLMRQQWMDWNVVFSVDQSSPYYNEADKMSIFYAQSWALTHMLSLSPAYSAKFSEFLVSAANGMATREALTKVYGKTISEVGKDVQNYVRQTSMKAMIFNITLSKQDLDAQVSDLSEFQIGLALADLLASSKRNGPEAERRLLALAQEYPRNAEVEESLGYLAWQQDKPTEARKYFGLAVEHGSKDARMIYDYAGLEHSNGALPQKVIDLMKQVIALKPDDIDARILLGNLETNQGQYGAALSVLSEVHTVKPEQAFNFFAVSAYCLANLKDLRGARTSAERALQYAKEPSQRLQIENLLKFLDQASQPPVASTLMDQGVKAEPGEQGPAPMRPVPNSLKRDQGLPRVHGKLKLFECGQGAFRLRLQVGDREMVFAMNNLQDIVVRNVKDLKWSCGPLKPQDVTVVYQPSENSKLAGTVAELVF